MIEFVSGDFFDYKANIRINTVNCVGVMGAGVALEFKMKYPAMFKAYVKACKNNEIRPGVPQVYDASDLFDQCIIINFPTKTDWRLPSEYEYIESGLKWLRQFLSEYDEGCSVTLPALGCGHGGLKWERVQPLIIKYLDDLRCHIYSFPPASSNKHLKIADFSDDLLKCNAVRVTPESYDYMEDTGDDIPFYYKGNRDNLRRKKIHLFVSKKNDKQAFEREFGALKAIADELGSIEFTFSLTASTRIDRNWAVKLLEAGYNVLMYVNEGILNAISRKNYEPFWDRLTVVSYERPDSTYQKVTMKNNSRGTNAANAVVLCNSNFDDITANAQFVMPFLEESNDSYYVKYWAGDMSYFSDKSIKSIGMNAQTGKPNVEGLIETLTGKPSAKPNEEKTEEDTTILDVIKTHKSICWYPSAGIDFRPLIIFNRSCYEAFEIPIDEEQTFPDLFILTDVNPPNYVWSGHSRPSPIENISCLNQEDKWEEITTLYEDKKTKITVNGSRRLKNLDIGCDRGELQSGYEVSKAYGNVLYFDVTVRSKRYESTEWDTWNANVLYVITENRTFAREVLMQNNIKIDYISVIRYGNSMGGGAAHSPDWLLGILGKLQCKYYVCNTEYAEMDPGDMSYFSEKKNQLPKCKLTELQIPKERKEALAKKWSNYGEVIWNRVDIT